jgi:hypothetical protein
VVNLSFSDTEEALKLLSLSPARGAHSPLSKLRSSSGSDLFKDWPEVNDMAMSVYVALTADALSSHASTVNAHVALKSLTLTAYLLDNPSHGQPHRESLSSKNLCLLVLHGGNLRGRRLMLSASCCAYASRWFTFCRRF